MKIRAATVSDGDMLAALASYNWLHAYAGHGVSRAMAAYVAGEFSPARYRSRLMEKGRMIWVMEHRQRLAGFAEVLLRATHEATAAATNLERLYLHAAFDDADTRAAFVQHIMKELGKYHITTIWLSVWHAQKDLLDFYAERGFRQSGQFFLEIDGEHHTHYILDNCGD